MRQIGTLSTAQEAQTFQDYLLTCDIKSKVEPDADAFAIWVFDEDDMVKARDELAAFHANPGDERYEKSRQEAARIRDALIKEAKVAQKNVVDVRRRWDRPLSSRCPVTLTLMAISIVVAFGSRLGEDCGSFCEKLFFASQIIESNDYFTRVIHGLTEIRHGEVWRLVTPIFLHFSFLHILGNMLWLLDLGASIESRKGSLRLAAMVLILAVISNTAQFLWSGPAFGGMSGVVFGLFGFVWLRGKYDPESGFFISPNAVFMMMAWYVICTLGLAGSIANMAHGAGLATGAVMGYAPVAWRDANRRM